MGTGRKAEDMKKNKGYSDYRLLRKKSEELQDRLIQEHVKYQVTEFYTTSPVTQKEILPFARTFEIETVTGSKVSVVLDPEGLTVHFGEDAVFNASSFLTRSDINGVAINFLSGTVYARRTRGND